MEGEAPHQDVERVARSRHLEKEMEEEPARRSGQERGARHVLR